ncbi:hypothetical protein LSAT2_004266 [Lamellibrachia satsuma]|nr:hypothetical protein LSAT2_004266 [Lamellibrachia satsuma]
MERERRWEGGEEGEGRGKKGRRDWEEGDEEGRAGRGGGRGKKGGMREGGWGGRWQLLPRPLSTLQFEKYVYVRERFFAMGLTLLPDSQRYCVLKTSDDGEVTMKFGIPEHLGRFAQFRYMLFKELADGTMSSSDSGESKINWKGCVFYQQSKEQLCYVCNMPTVGSFRMDVFGRHVKRDRDLDLVCSYVIVCDSTANRRLPDDPDIGWGPVTELEEAGLIAESHTDAMIDVTDPVVVIRFSKKTDKEMVFWHSLKHNTFVEEQLHSCIFLQPGMYAYKLFADIRTVGGDIPNVCNYLIRFKYNEGDPSSPFPPLRWGLVGPGIQARNLGIVATDREANIGYISTSSPDVNLTLKLPSSDYDIFYETGFLQRDGARQAVGVTVDTQGNKAKVRLTLKGSGEYSFNMFVRRPSDDIRIHHVHSVLIDYSEPLEGEGEDTSNDAPEDDGHLDERGMSRTDEQVTKQQVFSLAAGFNMMFGFGLVDSTNRGNDDETVEVPLDDEAVPTEQFTCQHKCMETYEEKYSIMLPMSGHDFLFSVERKAAQYPADFIRMERQDNAVGDDVLTTSLPLEGTYVVDVFAVFDDKRLVNVNRYNIHRLVKPEFTEITEIIVEQPQPNLEQIKQDRLFQKRTLRLMEAVRGKNLEKLSRAIEEFRDAQVPDGEELLKASERRLAFLQVSEDLTEGIKNKRLQLLYRGLKRAKKEDLREELHKLFDQANKLFIWLKRIEKINRKVMKLDNRAIAEIRRYKSPPDPIRDVMKGTLLVLGEPEKIVEEWKNISALMGKTGKDEH